MLTFDELAPGVALGPHHYRIDQAAFDRWVRLYPEDASYAPGLPSGLVMVAIMRAYMALADSPPGGIHAGQQLKMHRLPRIGDRLDIGLTCRHKEMRKGRRWAYFDLVVHAGDDLVAAGATTSIWSR